MLSGGRGRRMSTQDPDLLEFKEVSSFALILGAAATLYGVWTLSVVGHAVAVALGGSAFFIPLKGTLLGLAALGIGVFCLRATPHWFVLDRKRGTLVHWTGVVGRARLVTVTMTGRTRLVVSAQRMRKGGYSYTLTVEGPTGTERLFHGGAASSVRAVGGRIGEFLALPVADETMK